MNDAKVHPLDRATIRAEGQVGMQVDAGITMRVTDFTMGPVP